MKIYTDNTHTVGNTPLVRINNLTKNFSGNVYAKIESRNPGFSVKCRVAENIVADAEISGKLKKNMTIIESTSGNTGIGLAMVGAAKGYEVNICMPESMSEERKKAIAFFGAKLILTPASKGMSGAIETMHKLISENPDKYFCADQFNNPSNTKAHFITTGPEIWQQTEGKVDIIIAGVGTGGTITGISQYIKNVIGKKIITIAVEPDVSNVISNAICNKPIEHSPHGIQGIGAGFIPSILDLSLIDSVSKVSTKSAINTARYLAVNEGILCGISSGAAMSACLELIKDKDMSGKNIVVILPDSAERYMSTPLFDI